MQDLDTLLRMRELERLVTNQQQVGEPVSLTDTHTHSVVPGQWLCWLLLAVTALQLTERL